MTLCQFINSISWQHLSLLMSWLESFQTNSTVNANVRIKKCRWFLIVAIKVLHTALCPHYPQENVFSNRRKLLYDKPASFRCNVRCHILVSFYVVHSLSSCQRHVSLLLSQCYHNRYKVTNVWSDDETAFADRTRNHDPISDKVVRYFQHPLRQHQLRHKSTTGSRQY